MSAVRSADAIIGAIAGSGDAAIGAASGGAGAAAQIITRGRGIHVPAESVIPSGWTASRRNYVSGPEVFENSLPRYGGVRSSGRLHNRKLFFLVGLQWHRL
jgi:hypothetical protein